jgi:hypothetical protein
MKIEDIKIGKVYGNGKGMYRKVIGFSVGNMMRTTPYGADIHYIRCDENGLVNATAKKLSCWCSTFASWAKDEVKEREGTE